MLFYQNQKEDIRAEEVARLFENDILEIEIALQNIKKGKYFIKKNCLGPGKGNVLDNWKRLGYRKRLDTEEIRYLTSVSIPEIEYKEQETEADTLFIHTSLRANEIQLYKIKYLQNKR